MAALPSLITHRRVSAVLQTQEGGEKTAERENAQTLPDRRVTGIPNAVIVIKVNWLQLAA